MRVVHKKEDAALPEDPMQKARYFEKKEDWDNAIAAYQQVIRDHPIQEFAYNRLMIIFRKQKEYKKEKALIEKAIRAFDAFYKVKARREPSKKVLSLSKAFMKSTGLADKKGKPTYQKEPLGKWSKRLLIVNKRLKSLS